MKGESGMETYTLTHVIRSPGDVLHDLGNSDQDSDSLERWDGVRGGRLTRKGHMYSYGQSMLMYGRNIVL